MAACRDWRDKFWINREGREEHTEGFAEIATIYRGRLIASTL